MADKAKKEGNFGLTHIFSTVAIAAATTMIIGPMFEYNWTHFSDIGQALSQIGNALFMPVFDSMAPAVMPFLDPIRESLGITAEFAGKTAEGAKIIAEGSNAVSASELLASQGIPSLPDTGGIPLLDPTATPIMK